MPLDPKREYFPVVLSGYVLLERDGKVLLSRRFQTGYHDGEYSLPAGHLEASESATVGTLREAKEEVGIDIDPTDLKPAHIMQRHCGDHDRIDFFFTTTRWAGEISNQEPDRCDDLQWFAPDDCPKNTVPYIRTAIEKWQAGEMYSEFEETDW